MLSVASPSMGLCYTHHKFTDLPDMWWVCFVIPTTNSRICWICGGFVPLYPPQNHEFAGYVVGSFCYTHHKFTDLLDMWWVRSVIPTTKSRIYRICGGFIPLYPPQTHEFAGYVVGLFLNSGGNDSKILHITITAKAAGKPAAFIK